MTFGKRRLVACRRWWRIEESSTARAVIVLAILLPAHTWAQKQTSELSVQSTVTATNNGALAAEGFERSDVLVSVHPGYRYFREGTGLRVRASVEAEMIASTRNTQRDRVLPAARLDAEATVVERLLFLDSSVDVRQIEDDPFGARVEGGSSENTRTAGTYRLSPHLQYDIGPRTTLLARHDAAWTRYAGTTQGDSTSRQSSVRLDLKPRPFGGAIEWSSERTAHASDAEADLRIDRIDVLASVAVDVDWVFGAVAGAERSEFAATRETDRLYGLRLAWTPGPRTDLAAAVDRRFFGTGWNLAARHRTPRMSFVVKVQREPTTAATQLGGRSYASTLAGFLDAILTTRHPDAGERGSLVNDLIATRGLESSIPGAIGATADYAQLRTGSDATWVYLGTRTTLSLSAYSQRLRQLERSEGLVVATANAAADNQQRGASFGWNHRINPLTSLDFSASWSRIDGLALRAGDVTREKTLKAGVVRNLSPRTNMSAGLQLRRVDSDVTGVNSFVETSGFVGLAHRF